MEGGNLTESQLDKELQAAKDYEERKNPSKNDLPHWLQVTIPKIIYILAKLIEIIRLCIYVCVYTYIYIYECVHKNYKKGSHGI